MHSLHAISKFCILHDILFLLKLYSGQYDGLTATPASFGLYLTDKLVLETSQLLNFYVANNKVKQKMGQSTEAIHVSPHVYLKQHSSPQHLS